MTTRTTEYMPLRELRPDPRNPKTHDLEELRASLQRFGYVETITLDERTGLLVSGHGRYEVLCADRDAGDVPPDDVTPGDDDWLVPVNRGWSSADDDEAFAYLVAANAIGPRGGWDVARLADGLETLAGGSGLAGVGLDESDLERMMEQLGGDSSDDAASKTTPFAEFGPPRSADVVDFRFGDYSGKLARNVYDSFVAAYEARRAETNEVMLDDVMLIWLGLSA